MNKQLYRILDPGEFGEGSDITYNGQWEALHPGDIGAVVTFGDIVLRPVEVHQIPDHNLAFSEADPHLLTKREHYAGLAMQGLIANPNWSPDGISPSINTWDDLGCASLQAADALIAALNKKEDAV